MGVKKSIALGIFVFSLLMVGFAFASADVTSVWTTDDSCGEISKDVNNYNVDDIVFINGLGTGLTGDEAWTITGTPGSCDPSIVVASGTIASGLTGNGFCVGDYTVLADDCGVYKVNVEGKNDNYQVVFGGDEPITCTDDDQDGYYAEGGDCGIIDCDDTNPAVNPGATEVCNQVDDDCDGLVDEDDVCVVPEYLRPCGDIDDVDICTWDKVLPLGSEDTAQCGLDYNTFWPLNTAETATCTFSGNQLQDAMLHVSINNDIISCTLNGVPVFESLEHDGCAPVDPRDGFSEDISSYVQSGENTLVCDVSDRGIMTHFDACVVGEYLELPTCSVDYLKGVYSGNTYLFSDSIYISEIGNFEVYGSADANDPFCNMNTVQYNRTSPNPYYVPSWKTASKQNPDWSLWKTDVNDANFIEGWHEVCCLPTSQECSGGSCGEYIVGDDSCTDFCIDTQAPGTVDISVDNEFNCVYGYTNQDIMFSWTDLQSVDEGCAPLYYEIVVYINGQPLDPPIFTTDTTYTIPPMDSGDNVSIKVRAWDEAGNEGTWSSMSETIWYDITPPVVDILGQPWNADPNEGYAWYKENFYVEESDTDNLGVWKCEIKMEGGDWTEVDCNGQDWVNISEYCLDDGLNTCYVRKRVTDYACNTDDEGHRWDLDRTAPETTKTVSEPKYIGRLFEWIGFEWDLDWFVRDDTTFTLECNDFDMSGCADTFYRTKFNNGNWTEWMTYTDPFTLEFDGIYEVEYYSVDNLGNTEIAKYEIDKVDTIAPITTKTIGEPKYYDEEAEKLWVSSETFFSMLCEDSEVGCDGIYYSINKGEFKAYLESFNLDGDEGLHTIDYYSVDFLGNEEENNYEEDWLDNTPPEITIINPISQQQENKCSLSVVAQIWDSLSGVDDSSVTVNLLNSDIEIVKTKHLPTNFESFYSGVIDLEGLPAGEYTVQILATDNVENEAVAEIQITLLSGITVEQVIGNCNVEAGQEGDCTFAFQVCSRNSSAVSLWNTKLYSIQNGQKVLMDVIDPFTLNSTISNEYGSSDVGLSEFDTRFPETLTPLNLGLDQCEKINGRIYGAFDLTMEFSGNDTEIIGSNNYYFDYDLQAYNYDDEVECIEGD